MGRKNEIERSFAVLILLFRIQRKDHQIRRSFPLRVAKKGYDFQECIGFSQGLMVYISGLEFGIKTLKLGVDLKSWGGMFQARVQDGLLSGRVFLEVYLQLCNNAGHLGTRGM